MKRFLILVSGGLVSLVLLVSASFMSGRLLSGGRKGGGDGKILTFDSGEGTAAYAQRLEMINSSDVPEALPDAAGVFVRREDNSLFVGTGNLGFSVSQGEDGAQQIDASYDGPVLEVVVTGDTQIYRDDTFRQIGGEPPSGPIQQVIKPGSVEEIGDGSTLSAWGEKRGERLFADVLLYSGPAMFQVK